MFQQLPSKLNILKSSLLVALCFFLAAFQLGTSQAVADTDANASSAAEGLVFAFMDPQPNRHSGSLKIASGFPR